MLSIAKSPVFSFQNINKNAEQIMIERAKEGKIRLKLAGHNRKKKWLRSANQSPRDTSLPSYLRSQIKYLETLLTLSSISYLFLHFICSINPSLTLLVLVLCLAFLSSLFQITIYPFSKHSKLAHSNRIPPTNNHPLISFLSSFQNGIGLSELYWWHTIDNCNFDAGRASSSQCERDSRA